MSVGIIGTAVAGLSAYQKALDTTSVNITNANTPGYSVQHVEFATRNQVFDGGGVDVSGVIRSYDQFLNSQVRSSTSAYNGSNSFYTLAAQVDNVLADQDVGLSSSMSAFFSAVNGVANDPGSIPARQVMLTDANSLASHFNSIADKFSQLRAQVNNNLTASVSSLNEYAKSLSLLNTQITAASNNGTGQLPNGLLDQRDQVLNKIAELVDVSVVKTGDSMINVYIGNGQPLVVGKAASVLSVQGAVSDNSRLQVGLNGQDVSSQLSGGQITGNLQFRDQVLDPAQQQLGVLATGFATEFNKIHQSGVDLNGNPGLAFFDLGTPATGIIGQYSDKNLNVNVGFVTPSSSASLAASYRLDYTAAGLFNLTNLTDNTTITGLDAAGLATAAAADGFSFNYTGGALTAGDTFQISPSYYAAASIKVNPALTSPNQIAAASSLAGLPGDNSNALSLAQLQNQALMNKGSNTFSQVYGQMVAAVGNSTNSAKLNSSVQNTVLQNATSAQQSISGVNLDEEAAKLIQYQNAYTAAAKTINIAKSLFDTIIGAVN